MKYTAIIFDLDGVICHTDQYHYQAWKAIANKLNIPFDENINNRLRGVSRMESFNIILEKYDGVMSEEDKVKYAEEKNNIYKKLLENMSESDLSEVVRNTLVELRNRGMKLSIGSSSKNAKFILNQIGLGNFFDAISDGNNITHSKPDPEVFLKAAEYLNIPAENCLVVEDAVAGLEAAIGGGMDSCAIGDAVYSCQATHNLESFNGILRIVE
jgi:beta-phosphoglucomutase